MNNNQITEKSETFKRGLDADTTFDRELVRKRVSFIFKKY